MPAVIVCLPNVLIGLKKALFEDWGKFMWVAACGMSLVAMDAIPMQAAVFLAAGWVQLLSHLLCVLSNIFFNYTGFLWLFCK
jgi:hypothetical protein